ncbi:MAG: acetate--CoA ligase family protein [Pseudomonadota bacterium]
MKQDLSRFLRPQSIAVIGGAWARNVIKQLQKANYEGEIWPVHPKQKDVLGIPCFTSIKELPDIPDAAFVGVNRELTIDTIAELAAVDCGGAVCFASGFLESEADLAGGAELQQQLIEAAEKMPFFGPNCYGFVNYLDNIPIWPDEHGGVQVAEGVAVIAQSSNITISLSMQQRGLPIAYLMTAGNQAQTDAASIARHLLRDDRVTAIGFYLEGFGDIRSMEETAELARSLGKPLIALKSGKSEAAQHAALSHTASLAGSNTASTALLRRLGIAEVHNLDVFLETLKFLHFAGPLRSRQITSVSCSGGEAGLMADACEDLSLEFADLTDEQRKQLFDCLGPKVNLANPLDYHTYIWGDVAKMTSCFKAACNSNAAANLFVLDIPREDRCDPAAWDCVLAALNETKRHCDAPIAIISSIMDTMPESVAARCLEIGCIPLRGMRTGLLAVDAAAGAGELLKQSIPEPLILDQTIDTEAAESQLLNEYTAKQKLAQFDVSIPEQTWLFINEEPSAESLIFPCVLKAQGLAHKTENQAVVLNIETLEQLSSEFDDMKSRLAAQASSEVTGFVVESMVGSVIAELLVGIRRDATGLFLLTVGFGGTLTELMKDSVSLLLPCGPEDIHAALQSLKLYPLLLGYRGKPAVDLEAAVQQIQRLCSYVQANKDTVLELEVNPLMLRQHDAIAADALMCVSEY